MGAPKKYHNVTCLKCSRPAKKRGYCPSCYSMARYHKSIPIKKQLTSVCPHIRFVFENMEGLSTYDKVKIKRFVKKILLEKKA